MQGMLVACTDLAPMLTFRHRPPDSLNVIQLRTAPHMKAVRSSHTDAKLNTN
jgi:hypothetical protein